MYFKNFKFAVYGILRILSLLCMDFKNFKFAVYGF